MQIGGNLHDKSKPVYQENKKKKSTDDILTLFSNLSRKTGFDISCKLSFPAPPPPPPPAHIRVPYVVWDAQGVVLQEEIELFGIGFATSNYCSGTGLLDKQYTETFLF